MVEYLRRTLGKLFSCVVGLKCHRQARTWVDLLEAGEQSCLLVGPQLGIIQQIDHRVHPVQKPLHLPRIAVCCSAWRVLQGHSSMRRNPSGKQSNKPKAPMQVYTMFTYLKMQGANVMLELSVAAGSHTRYCRSLRTTIGRRGGWSAHLEAEGLLPEFVGAGGVQQSKGHVAVLWLGDQGGQRRLDLQ